MFSDHVGLWKVLERIIADPEVRAAYFLVDGLEQSDQELLDYFRDFTTAKSQFS